MQISFGLRLVVMGGAGIGESAVPHDRPRAEMLLKLVVGLAERLVSIDMAEGGRPVVLQVEDQLGYGAFRVGPNDHGELAVAGAGHTPFGHAALRRVLADLETDARRALGLSDPAAFSAWLQAMSNST